MGVVVPWLAEVILITYRDFKKGATDNVGGLPLPADYLATFAIFGVLGALPDSASTFAAVTGWGYVIATFLNIVDPTFTVIKGTSTKTATGPVGPVTTSFGVSPAVTPTAHTASSSS